MNILIVGANGQLGNEMYLHSQAMKQHQFIFTDIAESDHTDALLDATNREEVLQFCREHKVNLIVNCAAFTAVDKAETMEDVARNINALAPENLGYAMHELGGRVIHVSTDYVFNGQHCVPYTEDETPDPTGAYGRTKLEGEQLLLKACPESVILRTAWLYSTFGNNFVKTMLRLGQERDSLNVVYDQVGSPTNASDLAAAICTILEAPKFVPGIFHFTNEGVCSWYDFTRAIHQLAGIQCDVQPIRSEEYPTPTRRPNYSVLDKKKIKTIYGVKVPHWHDALIPCVNELVKQA